MPKYTNTLKQTICSAICEDNASTIHMAEHFNIPLKTVEKWVTAYNKDNKVFKTKSDIRFAKGMKPINKKQYASLSREQLRTELMKRDIELLRLKKGYVVRKSGGKLEYGTF